MKHAGSPLRTVGPRSPGLRALLVAAAATLGPLRVGAQVPTPESAIGWKPGTDYRLADYGQILSYFRELDAASDRLLLTEIGETAEGRVMVLAVISSAENFRNLDRYREISRSLALAASGDGGVLDEATARRLAREGKAIVWIDGGLHATEVAGSQFTSELAHRLVTEETEEARRIREQTIVLLMPVMNPDGLEMVTRWYRANVGTAYETAPLPWLYQKYAGHDNNRDFYMILQPETRAVARQLWQVWYPQIVLNHHQTAPFPGRIFIPPFDDPVNPRIPPLVITGNNLVGAAIGRRFAEEGKPGAVSRISFDQWWNGGMRTTPYFHNQVGILTEVALHRYATPRYYDPEALPRSFANGLAADRPSTWYPDPWRGGWWRLRDAVEYMVTASLAVAEIAARLKEDWLYDAYRMARRAIRAGEEEPPFAYVLSLEEQRDPGEAIELLNVLRRGGVEVHRATRRFRAGGREYPAGSYVIYAGQPFRAHLLDLMEPQRYPDRRLYPGGPPDPPYDLTGWSLPLQMGVRVRRIEGRFEADTEPAGGTELPAPPGAVEGSGPLHLLGPEANAAFRAVNGLLAGAEPGAGEEEPAVARTTAGFRAGGREWPAGTFVIRADPAVLEELARAGGLRFVAARSVPVEVVPLRRPRVGLYRSWVANMDEGWTRWVLERYGFAFETLTDRDVRESDLSRFDAIVLPDQSPDAILNGHLPGTMPPEYTGGIGVEGAARLKAFVEEGGLLLALDEAADLAIRGFGLPVRDAVEGLDRREFYVPGSLLRIRLDPEDPIAWGMPEEAAAFFVRSRAFRPVSAVSRGEEPGHPAVDVVARYASEDLLLSGWELGAGRHLAGRAAVVRVSLGAGQVVMVGFRPQFRGQPRGTFKLLFNALFASAAAGPDLR